LLCHIAGVADQFLTAADRSRGRSVTSLVIARKSQQPRAVRVRQNSRAQINRIDQFSLAFASPRAKSRRMRQANAAYRPHRGPRFNFVAVKAQDQAQSG
jgi:hypothetical protein